MFFIGLRQAYFLSSVRATRLSSRTVLFMNIPKEQQSEEALRAALGPDVRKVWMATDCKKLEDVVDDRNKAALKLEGAGVKLAKQANAARLKSEKKNPNSQTENRDPNHWINPKKRPTHRLKPIIGKKVDTINWARQEIPKLNSEIAKEQRAHLNGGAKQVGSAFVEFTSQASAQRAFQLAAKSKKKTMEPRYIDVQPDEVIWKNMNNSYATRKVKLAIATTIVCLIVIFWTPIIAFVGALTNINSLVEKVPFLSFILDIPSVILGVITGLLPVIILAVCIILVPIICRALAKIGGEPTLSQVELKTQSWYFVFQVIQVFLMTTFASGASAVAAQIVSQPQMAPSLLAENLPRASNFYISYFILYGLAQAGGMLLNIVALLLFVVLGKLFDKTPRKAYTRFVKLSGIGWGSEYPKWTNLGVIALSYSCIAPLVLGFATVGFTILYLAFRYRWLFVLGNQVDMKGEAYTKALQQLMTGVYLSIVCMIGLVGIGVANSISSLGPLILLIILLVGVVVFHVGTNYALSPLEKALPLDLISEDAHDYEKDGAHNGINNGVDVEAGHAKTTGSRPATDAPVTGNKLTQRLRAQIDTKFYQPNKSRQFILPEIDYDYEQAYYNPAITAEEPFIWLAKDPCGVSTMVKHDNNAAGIQTSDDFAWFDEKNKLHFATESDAIYKIDSMLDEKNRASQTEEQRVHQNTEHQQHNNNVQRK